MGEAEQTLTSTVGHPSSTFRSVKSLPEDCRVSIFDEPKSVSLGEVRVFTKCDLVARLRDDPPEPRCCRVCSRDGSSRRSGVSLVLPGSPSIAPWVCSLVCEVSAPHVLCFPSLPTWLPHFPYTQDTRPVSYGYLSSTPRSGSPTFTSHVSLCPGPVSVPHVSLSRCYEQHVSLSPLVTRSLDLLGVPRQGLPRFTYGTLVSLT